LEREKAKNRVMLKRIKATEGNNNDVIWIQPPTNKSENNESRPATTASVNFGSVRDPNDRKVTLLNKRLKSLRNELSALQRDNFNMRQVRWREFYCNCSDSNQLANAFRWFSKVLCK
jgi:hypothetical protein